MLEAPDLDVYARSAARLAGLAVEDEWWPGVLGHLTTLLDHAALLEATHIDGAESPAGVFEP